MQAWQEEKSQTIENAKTIIIKVGSAVLTNNDGLNMPILQNIVEQIATLVKKNKRVVFVSSGAVAAGKASLLRANINHILEGLSGKQAAAAVGQGKLIHVYDEMFAEHGILTAQLLLTRDDFKSRERFLNARNTLIKLLDMGVVPIVNENDTVSVSELKFGDNDALASYLLNAVEGSLIINLTSASGVLSKNPMSCEEGEEIPMLSYIEDIDNFDIEGLCGGKTSVGTGGMLSKLISAKRAAQLCVPTFILPGREKNIVLRAFAGEKNEKGDELGTWISCKNKQHISRKKYWLAYRTSPVGTLIVDEGASIALKEKGKSLLPAGIIGVEGDFKEGDLVRIEYNNKSFAVGLINYSSADMKKIYGKKRIEVAAILGNADYLEVIHRDNMLLDAAL